MVLSRELAAFLFFLTSFSGYAQSDQVSAPAASEKKPWYEKISLKGYTQLRYNRLLESNPNLVCEQCDRSLGNQQSFFIRRARITLSGKLHEQVEFYFQPDFATNGPNESQNFAQIRDAYADLFLDRKKEFRLRFGQSKIPFGWENLQSSGTRLAFDRADALNSGVPNERDVGVIFYWAPEEVRSRLKQLANPLLKGSGDYGVFALGAYNGQSSNRPEANNNRHIVARLAYPYEFAESRIIEPFVSAYSGEFTPSDVTAGVSGPSSFRDRRISAGFVLFPQPLGLQVEATRGQGPEYDPLTNSIGVGNLRGGYAQTMLRIQAGEHFVIPYLRAQYYRGGKKHETDARRHFVREYELGTEWQLGPAFELTAAYVISDRRTSDSAARSSDEEGNRLRLQAQFNY